MQSRRGFTTPWMEAEWKQTDEQSRHFAPHCHDRHEIYCFLTGAVDFRVEGAAYTLEPGSVLLLERSRFHSANTRAADGKPYGRLVLYLAPELLHPDETMLLDLFRRPEILYPGAWQKGIGQRAAALERAAAAPEATRNIAVRTEMVGLLCDLFAMSDGAIGASDDHSQIREVLAYINANLTEPLTLEGLAARFYMSRNSLARAFKRATGTTVPDYILYKRMALARILLQAGHPLGVTARECGYADYSTFYRSYRKVFGQRPSEPLESAAPATNLAPDPEAL